MKCADPQRHTRQNATTITKREANHFVDALLASIEKTVLNTDDRQNLFERLAAAMPPTMRRRGELVARDRAMLRVTQDIADREAAKRRQEMLEQMKRESRRRKLREQLGDYLTDELYKALKQNEDLLDPDKFFARKWGDTNTDPKKDGSQLPAVDPRLRLRILHEKAADPSLLGERGNVSELPVSSFAACWRRTFRRPMCFALRRRRSWTPTTSTCGRR